MGYNMKKIIALFIIFSGMFLYSSEPHNSKSYRFRLSTPRRPCQCGVTDATRSGFGPVYRKELGNQYFREAIEDQQAKLAKQDSVQVQVRTSAQTSSRSQTVLQFSNVPQLPIKPRRTSSSFTHLRTPKNAQEIQGLLIIRSIFPDILKLPQITQFDISPDRYFLKVLH